MKKTALGIVLILCTVTMGSCFKSTNPPRVEYFETEYFTYYYTYVDITTDPDTPSNEWAIMELTEKGKELERIAIPSHIDGLPVTQFGLERTALWASTMYHFESDNLKKVILPYTVVKIPKFAISGNGKLRFILYPGMCDSSEWRFSFKYYSDDIMVFVSYRNFKNIDDYRRGLGQEDVVAIANVTYNLNFEGAVNEGIYTLDQVEEEEAIIEPEVPKREGYAFQGWHKEVECVTKFDFVRERVQKEESLGTMMLYAKWEKQ